MVWVTAITSGASKKKKKKVASFILILQSQKQTKISHFLCIHMFSAPHGSKTGRSVYWLTWNVSIASNSRKLKAIESSNKQTSEISYETKDYVTISKPGSFINKIWNIQDIISKTSKSISMDKVKGAEHLVLYATVTLCSD